MNLDRLNVVETKEKTMEMRELTVTVAFEFEDGKCTDAELQPLYDYLAPKAVEEETIETDEPLTAQDEWVN